jgi:hypothetical protein
LIARVPLKLSGWECLAFLGEGRVVHFFYNWAERPTLPAPLKRWVLATSALPDKLLTRHTALDTDKRENAVCRLAVNEAGWIAASVDPAKIFVFDAALALQAEIEVKAEGADLDALAIDAKGAVTAILRTGANGDGRRILRYAKIRP